MSAPEDHAGPAGAADPAPVLDPELMAIIVCPDCRSALVLEPGRGRGPELVCQGCALAYPVRDGIPVLLVDEARRP